LYFEVELSSPTKLELLKAIKSWVKLNKKGKIPIDQKVA
jgi:hypothetical protein